MAVNKLHFQATMDGTGFSRGLSTLNNSVGTFKNALVGAFGTFAVGSLIKGTIDWASKLQDSADALGVNVEFLQKLQNGAKLAGADISDVTKFMQEMNKSRLDAMQNPTGKNAAALGRLGISGADIGGLSTEGAMKRIMETFKTGLTVEGATDLQEVGGRSARRLAAAFANQFASDAPILSAAMIEQLDTAGDRLTDLATMLKVTLAPAIIWVTDQIRGFINWLKQLGAFLGGMFWHTIESGFSGEALNAFTAGGQSALEEESKQKAEQASVEKSRAAVTLARKAREGSGIVFEPLLKAAAKETKAPYSDALLNVGNFLGAGSNMVNSIADQQLAEARTTNQKLDDANTRLDKIADKLGDLGDGIEVP